ncbi:MAG: flagellar biosynthesis protein FlhF [Oscillospiraceae bacterium]|jgi:flagellar biosynthesis protein FlhF|nr:flagellar biosynthesis protein FlhF [Oscillospiraceae bacterium]
MNVKRYIGADVAECMAQVREELGVDAFILTQRTVRQKGLKGLFQKPMVEVVAAYEPETKTPSRQGASSERPRYTLTEPAFPPPSETAAKRPAQTPPPRPASAPKTSVPDIRQEDAQAAAMSVLERIAQSVGSQPPAQSAQSQSIPPAPPSISAYSPHAIRRSPVTGASAAAQTPESLASPAPPYTTPKSPDKDDAFKPVKVARIDYEEDGQREIARISNLESKIDNLSTTLGTLVNKMQLSKDAARGSYPAAVEELLLSLIENDVHEEFAHKLAREAAEIIYKQSADARDVMEQLVRQTIGEPSPLKLRRFQRTVVMLVGPTGVGKTTTLAKLAAIYQLNHHAKVGVITTDTFRIAAVQQLKTYAEILEIPLSVVYSPADIADALREHEDKDVVLIDTAGKSPSDTTLEAEITELIKNAECDEVHLVLSATTGFTGLLNIINTYSFLRDYKVLFTKLDETPSWGMVLNTKFLTDKPISYIASGQTVPDDIEVMTPRKLIDRLLGTP